MTKTKLVLALLAMFGFDNPEAVMRTPRLRGYVSRAHGAAIVILSEVKATDDIALVAAMGTKESGMVKGAVGAKGEIGRWQIKPDGMAAILCKDLDIRRQRGNLRCALRIMKHAKGICGDNPRQWLGIYNGKGTCGPGRYSKRVLATRDRAARYFDEPKTDDKTLAEAP